MPTLLTEVQHVLLETLSFSWDCPPSVPSSATAISNCNLTQPAIKHSRTGESSI